MSGTSMDAVDYALCDIGGRRLRLLRHWQAVFPRTLRKRLQAAALDELTSHELARLHHDLGRFYAGRARRGPRPDLVGMHGQTIFHGPGGRSAATLQIGESAYLVEALRVPVVSNFRAADVAAGGQGAPLATLFHERVFARRGRHVCVNNLGGISNVTSLDWRRGSRPRRLAFDTGPGNLLLDAAARHFSRGGAGMDRNGAWAARGRVAPLLEDWLQHPFFRRRPPKSTGREEFGERYLARALRESAGLSRDDVLATLTEFTARSVALNYRWHLPGAPDEVILCGGGAANRRLVERIGVHLKRLRGDMDVVTCAERGWHPQAIEPAAFALLAWLRWRHRPGNAPETTGAGREVLAGQMAAP